MATLSELTAQLQGIVGDVPHEGNTKTWEPEEFIRVLNWAQDRYCEATKCTFTTVEIASDADGIIPLGSTIGGTLGATLSMALKIVSVSFPDAAVTDPDATITVASTATHGASITASVDDQSGATYFWSVAGGTITAGQGTDEVTITAMNVAGATMCVGVTVQLNDSEDSSSADVILT